MKTIIRSFFLIFFLSGCITPVTLEFEEFKPEIAINCMFTSDQYFNVNITFSKIITDSVNYQSVTNASVTIKAIKENVVHKLFYKSDGNYCDTSFYPQFGEAYQLTVEVPGFETMTATDSLPKPPNVISVLSVLTDQTSSVETGTDGYKTTQHYITLADNGNENNYFELRALAFDYDANKFYQETITSKNPIITNEHANEYFVGTLNFTNELFKGDTITLYCEQCRSSMYDDKWIGLLKVYSISEKLYRFKQIFRKHRASSYDIVYPVEPVIMESGIENAYGIFAGYTATDFIYNPTNQTLPE